MPSFDRLLQDQFTDDHGLQHLFLAVSCFGHRLEIRRKVLHLFLESINRY